VNNLNSPASSSNSSTISQNFPNQLKSKSKTLANNIFYVVDKSNVPFLSLDVNNDSSLTTNILLKGQTDLKEYVITPNFSLQRWEHVIISVNQSYIDLYLDGKLMSSTFSKNKIIIPTDSDNIILTKVGQQSDYYVSGLNIKTTAMDPKTALQNYNNGKSKVNGNTNISLALTKNENVAKNFILF
jgi:hypothetical protein